MKTKQKLLFEETVNKFLNSIINNKSLVRDSKASSKKVANIRFEDAKKELSKANGGNFWENSTKNDFFNDLHQKIQQSNLSRETQERLIEIIDAYQELTPTDLVVKSDSQKEDEDLQKTIDNENKKPVKDFSRKSGPHGILSPTVEKRKELEANENIKQNKAALSKAYNSGKNEKPKGILFTNSSVFTY